MSWRLSLLALTAAAAGLSAVANAISGPPEETRMGVAISKDIAQRDKAAAARNRTLDLREQAARSAEQRLKVAAASRPAAAAATGAPPAQVSETERFEELARIYQVMKPKAAAQVFEQLTIDLQVEVAQRMRERSTALIMAAMSPKGAAALTTAMARKGTDKPGWNAIAPAAPGAPGAGASAPASAPASRAKPAR